MWCDLYLIADAGRVARGALASIVERAMDGGVTAVQLRDKDASPDTLLPHAADLCARTHARGVSFLVNDHLDVALAVGADGVHLGPDDLPVRVARARAPHGMLVGFSAATPREAEAAAADGASYLGVGAVRATTTKADAGAPIGAAGVGAVRSATTLPIVAIGGIGVDDVDDLIRAGADGIAVASAILGALDPTAAARALADALHRARIRHGRA